MLGLKLNHVSERAPWNHTYLIVWLPDIFHIAPLSLSLSQHTDWLKRLWLNFCCDQILRIMFYKLDSMIFILIEMIINHRIGLYINGPLTKYVILQVVHAPGMPGTFSPLPISKEIDS